MAMVQIRLKSAKQKKAFKRMAAQSSLFRMITGNFQTPKSLSPRKFSHVKMPDLKPVTIRKHIFEDVSK